MSWAPLSQYLKMKAIVFAYSFHRVSGFFKVYVYFIGQWSDGVRKSISQFINFNQWVVHLHYNFFFQISGSFTHKFTVSDKTYYYWSGFVDERDEIHMKGVIKVLPLSSNIQTVSVMVADYAAFYNTDSGMLDTI